MKRNIYKIGKELFITSDEEIKFNDYITDVYKVWQWKDDSSLLGRKKIILTTDLDLIKNGVQSIDDEFLQWLIKNPSCKWVEVEKGFADGTAYGYNFLDYKIIIPSEKPKELTDLEIAIKLEEIEKEQPKQETIEEAFSKTYFANKISFNSDIGKAFELGAKYQAERMYSEEEVLELLTRAHFVDQNIVEWFNQHKKQK